MNRHYEVCGNCGATSGLVWNPIVKKYFCVDEHACTERFIERTFPKKQVAVCDAPNMTEVK